VEEELKLTGIVEELAEEQAFFEMADNELEQI
jgi:hypothetical protein